MPLSLTTSILLTGAAYEYHHHAPDFLAAGGTQRELDDLAVFVAQFSQTNSPLTQVNPAQAAIEIIVIQYAAEMTVNVKVHDATFVALLQHFDTTQIVELTSAIATYNMVARFLVALGVSPEEV
jgi:alkylhydroperoxidase family enzyme